MDPAYGFAYSIIHPEILTGFNDFGGGGVLADKRHLLAVPAFEFAAALACLKTLAQVQREAGRDKW